MNLKDLAASYAVWDNTVVFYVMPYTTVRAQIIQEQFNDVVPRERWAIYEDYFILIEGSCIDIDFDLPDDAPVEHRALQVYWQSTRTATLAEKWEMFTNTVNAEIVNAFWEAYEHIRNLNGHEQVDPEEVNADPKAEGVATKKS